jgi:hypothetical protein
MFNPMRPDQLIVGIGRVLREAADADGTLDDYRRSQLLSAYSISRNLAAEQAATAGLLAQTKADLVAPLAGDGLAAVPPARAAVAAAADGAQLGEALADLLAALRADPAPEAARLRAQVQGVLHAMVDREVAALAAGPPA